MEHVDVVVAGGGPTGMTVAGDLARAGRSVVVLERWPELNPSSRAFATMARTLELLDHRGLADDLLALGSRTPEVRLFRGAALDLTALPSRYRFALITPQTNIDRALGRYAADRGAVIHRGLEVVEVAQDDAGVTVTARARSGGAYSHYRARYVVGADGAHSTVRGLLGVPFPGKRVLASVVLADVRLTSGPDGGGLTLGSTPDAFGFLAPYGRDGMFRAMTWDRRHQVPDGTPVADQEVTDVLRRAMGRDVGVAEITWRSRFHCDERQATDYRAGRVFLAGDAAHVHSPMGGQGMNTGIQDAVNLAWKLDAALGGAPDAVLDTYQAERRPIGRRVLAQSGAMMRAVTLKPPPARWLRDHLAPLVLGRPGPSGAIAGSFTGVGLRYRHRRGEHRLVGTRAEQVPLAGTTLAALLRTPGWVLVRERGTTPADPGPADPRTADPTPTEPGPATGVARAERTDDGPALLVRPDGYVAWAGDSAGGGWAEALARWTGRPASHHHRDATTATTT